MEPSIVFAGFILCLCAMHLVWRISEQIAKWWAKSRPEQSSAKNSAQNSVKKAIRSDWYVFFSCSDLLGKDPGKKQDSVRKNSYSNNQKSKRDLRPVARV
jgi:hypothetical protein